jgi:hypothetical protein
MRRKRSDSFAQMLRRRCDQDNIGARRERDVVRHLDGGVQRDAG